LGTVAAGVFKFVIPALEDKPLTQAPQAAATEVPMTALRRRRDRCPCTAAGLEHAR
jgi:hypothetical protein